VILIATETEAESPETVPDIQDYDYIILGCGSVGFRVIRELVKSKKKIFAVDQSKEKVEVLREQNFDAVVGDIIDENILKSLNLDSVQAVLILTPSPDINKKVVQAIRERNKAVFIITRGSDPKSKEELEDAGADVVLIPSNVMATSVISYLTRIESVRRARQLSHVIEDVREGELAILTHNNPDPDAISSAMTLKEIAERVGVNAEIIYFGNIGHQENQALVNLLKLDMKRGEEVDLSSFSKIALVDSSRSGNNNTIPSDLVINIVIDHHPPVDQVEAEYVDIRLDVGATATIMTKYLQELDIIPSKELATALFFGIKSETDEFKRNTHPSDFTAAAFLYPYVDKELIEKLETPAMSAETLDILGAAITNRQVYGSYLISNVGVIRNRDALPQAADYLLKLEGVTTAIVFGIGKEHIYISARNKDIRVNIGDILKRAFGDVGSAGGHPHAAGAQIPLGVFGDLSDKQSLMNLVEEVVTKRFLEIAGVEGEEGSQKE
jgi:nanoRNase/pAp phosphatase (c-di-AMP/oligoRNAs hydrolase)